MQPHGLDGAAYDLAGRMVPAHRVHGNGDRRGVVRNLACWIAGIGNAGQTQVPSPTAITGFPR
jgi:hypothetical protein